ncbi:hypothetical protein [Nocardia arizonensis]|uniref:hypothetical protein n=1 Tax=Nocardia arizonensis TaxID=1141647 RepID=UPI000A538C5D|nr:hypothetical protein [Nocardia arizonensis]
MGRHSQDNDSFRERRQDHSGKESSLNGLESEQIIGRAQTYLERDYTDLPLNHKWRTEMVELLHDMKQLPTQNSDVAAYVMESLISVEYHLRSNEYPMWTTMIPAMLNADPDEAWRLMRMGVKYLGDGNRGAAELGSALGEALLDNQFDSNTTAQVVQFMATEWGRSQLEADQARQNRDRSFGNAATVQTIIGGISGRPGEIATGVIGGNVIHHHYPPHGQGNPQRSE